MRLMNFHHQKRNSLLMILTLGIKLMTKRSNLNGYHLIRKRRARDKLATFKDSKGTYLSNCKNLLLQQAEAHSLLHFSINSSIPKVEYHNSNCHNSVESSLNKSTYQYPKAKLIKSLQNQIGIERVTHQLEEYKANK